MNIPIETDHPAFNTQLKMDHNKSFSQSDCIDVSVSESLTNHERANENQSLIYFLEEVPADNSTHNSISELRTVDDQSSDDCSRNTPLTIFLCRNDEGNTIEAHFVIEKSEVVTSFQPRAADVFETVRGDERQDELNNVSGGKVFIASCTDYEKPTRTADSDNRHVKDVDGKTHACKISGCSRKFKWAANLHYHMMQHSGARPHKCAYVNCDKAFLTQQRLQVHILTHTGEKPFECTYGACHKSFSTAGNLKNHSRTHTGEKPFACEAEKCGKRFSELSSLKKHANTHTGVKQFPCPECGRYFAQASSRNIHMNKHRKDLDS